VAQFRAVVNAAERGNRPGGDLDPREWYLTPPALGGW
jgi:hypothetical protein